MTPLAQARAAADQYLISVGSDLPPGDSLVLLDEQTIERYWGWVFFYTSRLWRQTGEAQYALAGNAPILVERQSWRVLPTGTALPIEQYIANYERTGSPGA